MGRVGYGEAWDLQQRLFAGTDNHLLLLEHPAVYTLGRSADRSHLLVDPVSVGASVHSVNRGGDVTFHGPGQIVGYPILNVAGKRGGGLADTAVYVASVEQLLIDALADLGLVAGRLPGFPGVWVEPDTGRARKIAAIGVRLSRGRSMHGFALNHDVDLDWFDTIVPCGIADRAVTSLEAEGITVSRAAVVEALVAAAARNLLPGAPVERSDVVFDPDSVDLAPFSRGLGPGRPVEVSGSARAGRSAEPRAAQPDRTATSPSAVPVRLRRRLDQAGVGDGMKLEERKPAWMRVKLETGPTYLALRQRSRDLGLTTVCEEAGCPNIFECWNEGTATFMLLGERCTRACGFCLVDTSKPLPVDADEPRRVADAVSELGLDFAVLTMVARDDLADGGAAIVAETVTAIKDRSMSTGVEVLISDLKGSSSALATVCDAEPDVVNHNIETVARLQRAVRPSASYARSLTVLARAADRGRLTKSGLIVGMGETEAEVLATMADLAAVGVSIITIGQYLRPTSHHLPIDRWWHPDEFEALRRFGQDELGVAEVVASPLTRSSHHAGVAADAVRLRAETPS